MLLPGFWAEYGMCTEPSAFGAKCVWYENAFPSAAKMLHDYGDMARLKKPNCRTDGLLPFVIRAAGALPAGDRSGGPPHPFRRRARAAEHRLLPARPHRVPHRREDQSRRNPPPAGCRHRVPRRLDRPAGRDVRFDRRHLPAGRFDRVSCATTTFKQFALPYLKQIFESRKVSVRFLHNDAAGIDHRAAPGGDGREPVQFLVQPQPGRRCGRRQGPRSCCWAISHPATCWPKAPPTMSVARGRDAWLDNRPSSHYHIVRRRNAAQRPYGEPRCTAGLAEKWGLAPWRRLMQYGEKRHRHGACPPFSAARRWSVAKGGKQRGHSTFCENNEDSRHVTIYHQ